MEALFFWVGGAAIAGIVTTIVSLAVQWQTVLKIEPVSKLATELRETQLQLSDLAEHIERKETRERVRRMRDGREAAKNGAETPPPPGSPEYKAYLRRLALQPRQ